MRASLKKITPTSQERLMFYSISWVATQRNVAGATLARPVMVMSPNRMSPKQVAEYERGLAAAMAQTDTHPLSPYAVEAYRQCAQEVREIGATPIFLITPSTTQINMAAESTALAGVVMAFNNPQAYPSL